ncbi:MAG TPA: maleylpyruvate isomerase N-terminal domain-containing protein [Streptosporangiaceae bacterium]|nr:maleylpyruvate isomerase N-terminal domain-containing protein [Streptosporangiaceae bacterium]
MEVGNSWDRPVPLAAPVLADAETDVPVAYDDGVRAIVEIAAQFTRTTWNAPTTCPEWRAADLAGHLRCVAEDYHEYLDDAPVSRLSRLMATGAQPQSIARKLARQNAAELATLPDVPPAEHIAAFARSASRYAARIGPLRTLPHHSYRGQVISVTGMAGIACVEWHLHAWDLASALGISYRPADPGAVLTAWLSGIPMLLPSYEPDPWLAVLRVSGRLPGLSGSRGRFPCPF